MKAQPTTIVGVFEQMRRLCLDAVLENEEVHSLDRKLAALAGQHPTLARIHGSRPESLRQYRRRITLQTARDACVRTPRSKWNMVRTRWTGLLDEQVAIEALATYAPFDAVKNVVAPDASLLRAACMAVDGLPSARVDALLTALRSELAKLSHAVRDYTGDFDAADLPGLADMSSEEIARWREDGIAINPVNLDAPFNALMRSLDHRGSIFIEAVDVETTDWAAWLPTWDPIAPPKRLVALATALLASMPELAADPRNQIVGVNDATLSFAVDAMRRGNYIERHMRGGERQLDWLLDPRGGLLAHNTYLDPFAVRSAGVAGLTLEVARESAEALSSLGSIALLHFYARRSFLHHQRKAGGFDDLASTDQFTDQFVGYDHLARCIGITPERARERLEPVLRAHEILRGDYHGVLLGGLVGVSYDGQRGNNKPMLRISYLDPIRPSFVAILEKRLESKPSPRSAGCRIVPMVGLPPLRGRHDQHAMQAHAALQLSAFIRARAEELVERDGVAVPRAERERIAAGAGFARRGIGQTAENLFSGWATASRNQPPMIEFVGSRDDFRVRFSDHHRDANEAIIEAGKRVLRGRRGGRKRTAEKRSDATRRPRR